MALGELSHNTVNPTTVNQELSVYIPLISDAGSLLSEQDCAARTDQSGGRGSRQR